MESLQLVKSISVKYPIGRCLPPILLLTLYRLSVLCNYDFELFINMLNTFLKIKNFVFLEELDTIHVLKTVAGTNIRALSPTYSLPYRILYLSNNIEMQFIICNKCGNYISGFLTMYCCASLLRNANCVCYKQI